MSTPVAAAALALAIAAAAALALWWLLRGETRPTLLALAGLTALGLGTRLLWPSDYPAGLNEDEPKVLAAALRALHEEHLLAESNISVPVLMHALFQATLVPLLGAGQWTIRLYSLVGGTLCVPAAFAAARGLGLSVTASLGGASLVGVLPWALFYSRVMQGAELTFQQLLLLAALTRLIWRGGGAGEALLGAFAVGWMSYGYWCTRAMLAMPLLAALLARGRARLWCLATLAGLALYVPYVRANADSVYLAQGLQPAGFAEGGGLAAVAARLLAHAQAFVAPVAQDGWLTVAAAAQHPLPLLLLAAAGLTSGWRRGVFLGGGFLAGLAPSVLAWGPPSTHRMLMAFPFVALAAAAACDALRGRDARRWRMAVAAVALATAVWSLRFYYSDDFWRPESRWRFDAERTALIAALPLAPGRPVFLMRQVTQFAEPRRWLAADDRTLSADAWLPAPTGAVYAFTAEAALLRPLYEALFGAARVQAFGAAFVVDVPAGDWSGLHQHGWTYTARCGAETRRAVVPALFQPHIGFDDLDCDQPYAHLWEGRWQGEPARLRVRGAGASEVVLETPRARLAGVEVEAEVVRGDRLRVESTSPPRQPWAFATLVAVTPSGESVPAWESVEPMEGAATAAPHQTPARR